MALEMRFGGLGRIWGVVLKVLVKKGQLGIHLLKGGS